MPDHPQYTPQRLPTLVSTDRVVLPPGESDETKRLALATWAQTQNLRSLTHAASGVAVLLGALILRAC